MALCDFLISSQIQGYDCSNPPLKGVERTGYIFNRSDIVSLTKGISDFSLGITLEEGSKIYKVVQSGKNPFSGTQQEMQEGTYQNTITNTIQLVILAQDSTTAEDIFALANGEFVVILENRQQNDVVSAGNYQVYGSETGLHCTGAIRELYNDDTLAGWQITLTEEGCAFGTWFTDDSFIDDYVNGTP